MTASDSSNQHKSAPSNAPSSSKDSLLYWRKRIWKRPNSPYYYVEIQRRGVRRKFSLETSNPAAAAARARQLWQDVQSLGWDEALIRHRPVQAPKADLTIGEFITQAVRLSGANQRTSANYARTLRLITSDLLGPDASRAKVDATPLGWLTNERVRQWKALFLFNGRQDAVSMRSRRVSVNSVIRQSKSLFSPRILKQFPVPITSPFTGIEFEPRQSMKYRGTFDVRALFASAQAELAESDPEAFKAFLLALCAGLRRHEIDLLEWSAFRWDQNILRIEPTTYFTAKSEDSIGDVAIDPEIMTLFRGYRAKATGVFVIETPVSPRPGVAWMHYRSKSIFRRLTDWLRAHGVKSRTPLHTLRKEFGSIINQQHGIHAASSALRHADLTITSQHYVDSRNRAAVGLGYLLDGGKIVPLDAAARQALGDGDLQAGHF